jgi:hypothetical protein
VCCERWLRMETKELVSRMEAFMAEVVELRSSVELPRITDQADEIVTRLQHTRQAIDRIEEIWRTVGRTKAMAQRQMSSLENVANDAWANALRNLRALPTFRNTEYVGPRERYAEADLSTMDARMEFRRAQEQLSHIEEAYDFVKTVYFGMKDVREDIKDILRAQTVQTRMELQA